MLCHLHAFNRVVPYVGHEAIQKMFKAANSILDTLYGANMFLDPKEQKVLKGSIDTFGKYFQLAQKTAIDSGDYLWHLTPKTHQTMHIPKQALLINPVAVQCYKDESFVGVVTKIWHGCAQGGYLKTVQWTVLFKWLLALTLQLEIPLDD